MKTDVSLGNDGEVTLYRGGKKVWRGPVAELSAQLGLQATTLIPRTKKAKPKSRGDRWNDAATAAVSALSDLEDIRQEYSDWKDNLPENLQNSTLGEKLDAVIDLDIEGAKSTAEEAEAADLPLGFGRD